MAEQVPRFPRSLRKYVDPAADLRDRWCYVVLEEIVDGVALLLRWPWPFADREGRLPWPPEDDLTVCEASIRVGMRNRQL